MVYDYPSISALASYVRVELGGAPGRDGDGDDDDESGGLRGVAAARLGWDLDPREPFLASSGRFLLVTGSSARAPARPSQPAAPATGDAIRRVPRARWDMQAYMAGYLHVW